MTGAPGAAASVHPPPPHHETVEEGIARLLARAAKGAGHVQHHEPNPYVKVHPELDEYLVWLQPWGIRAYHRYKRDPENEKAQRVLFHRLHPFRTFTGWRVGRKAYRNEHYMPIWQKIKLKAEAGTRERMGQSESMPKLVGLWYLYHAVANTKYLAFGGWWYLANAAVRRIAFNLGIGINRKEIKRGRLLGRERTLSIPVGPRLTGTSFIGHLKAGHDGVNKAAEEFYVRGQVPKKNYGLRHRARLAWTAPSQFRSKYMEAHGKHGPKAAAAGADPEATSPAPHDAPTVDLGVTTHGPTAEPPTPVQPTPAVRVPARHRTPAPPAPAATTPVPAHAPVPAAPPGPGGPPAAAPAEWQHLTPQLREAIGREVTALREARRQSPEATREFADTDPLFTRAYTMVLQKIRHLDPSVDPDVARAMAQNVLSIERIGGHAHSTLLERDVPTLARLNTLYQISTAERGTKLGPMQALAGATVDGKPTKAQMGVTFTQARAAVATQLRSGGGLAL
jgi:hypothetical protein